MERNQENNRMLLGIIGDTVDPPDDDHIGLYCYAATGRRCVPAASESLRLRRRSPHSRGRADLPRPKLPPTEVKVSKVDRRAQRPMIHSIRFGIRSPSPKSPCSRNK